MYSKFRIASCLVVAVLLLATQVQATSYIGNISTVYVGSGSYSPYSYVVEKTNSTFYQATNGTTGQAEFVSTNASYVFQQAFDSLSNGGAIFAKGGRYIGMCVQLPFLGKTFKITGEGMSSTVLVGASGKHVFNASNSGGAWGGNNHLVLEDLTCEAVDFTAIGVQWWHINFLRVKINGTVGDSHNLLKGGGAGADASPSSMTDCTFESNGGLLYSYMLYLWYECLTIENPTFLLVGNDIRGLCYILGTYCKIEKPVIHSWSGRDITVAAFSVVGSNTVLVVDDLYYNHSGVTAPTYYLFGYNGAASGSSIYCRNIQVGWEDDPSKICNDTKTANIFRMEGWYNEAYPPVAYSYVVWTDGTNYYAQNGTTHAIEFLSTNASYIWQQTVRTSGSVFWKDGLFNFQTRITVPDNVSITIQGEGMNCTTLKYTGTAASAFLTVGHVLQCTLRDLGFNANNMTSHVLNWTGANPGPLIKPNTGGIIDSCHFTDSSDNYGVVLHRWYDDANNPVQFYRNKITMCPGALWVDSGDNTIEGNGFSRNGKIAYETGFGFADLKLSTSGTNRIIGNYFGGRPAWGIYVNSAYNIITDNIIDRHSNESIYVQYSEGNIISNNALTQGSVDASNTYSAIKLAGSASQNNTISDNVISQKTETDRIKYGVEEYNKAYRNFIFGNFIEDYGTAPFLLNASTYLGDNFVGGWLTRNAGAFANCLNGTWISHGLAGDPASTGSITLSMRGPTAYNATTVLLVPTVLQSNSTKFQIEFLYWDTATWTLHAVTVGMAQTIWWDATYKP